ncbi:hypothetical protein MNEG_14296 [Monoraphidium neglectum]|uniref:Uncharacterized protein n=1 Tax=Monoraphidium neglectum TaxID=145388 RepID=A0A0D2LVU3_9CHLO|nr:hypothetical protein MNEG_14296 [Monoraphidium neglectum]KIY93666.1 hypothetical protein MNEG_14296 [Monoraphidium neglectum]|eukprot:XP_013892686.1 hypothetical protein MNEG_14296 [Monoraphidium neglectum]
MIAAQELALPEDGEKQMALFLRKSRAHLALGQSEAFCSELMPLVEAALQREEAIAELAASGAAAAAGGGAAGEDGAEGGGAALPQKLRRALVRLGKDGARREGAEEESVFKGYKSRNRRKHDVIAADQAAAALVTTLQRRAAAAGGGGGGCEGDGGGGGEGEGVLPGGADLFEDDQFFDSFVQLCRALASSGRGQAAAVLVARAAAMAKAAAGSAAKVEYRDRAAVMRALGSSGAARRRRAQLRQLAAEVECATGDARSSAHHVRSLCSSVGEDRHGPAGRGCPRAGELQGAVQGAARAGVTGAGGDAPGGVSAGVGAGGGGGGGGARPPWAYSWAAWGLYCRVLSRLGGLRRWGRFVRVMRAKHPDSLALAVLQAHALEQSGDHSEASGEYAVALRWGQGRHDVTVT